MYCRVCDIEYPKALRFCKWCGGGLVEKEAVGKQHCPACGSAVNKEWLFCNECGVDLASLGAQPKDQTCPSCGAGVRKGWMFCRQCGEQIATERAERNCVACGAGLRDGWAFCKQCGAPAAGAKPAKPAVGAQPAAQTVVGIPAVGTEIEEDEPFSGLASGELPALDDVITGDRRRRPPKATPPPPPPDQALPGGTKSFDQNRSTGQLDERSLEREYRDHPIQSPPQPAGAAPPAQHSDTIQLGAVDEPPPSGYGTAATGADDMRTVAIPALGGTATPPAPAEPYSNPTVLGSAQGGHAAPPADATVALPPPPPMPAADPTVAMHAVPAAPSAPDRPKEGFAPAPPLPVPDAGGHAASRQKAAAASGGGSALKWITAAVAVLALLAVAAVGAIYVLSNREQPAPAAATAPAPAPASAPTTAAPPPAAAAASPSAPEGMVLVEAGSYTIGTDSPTADAFSRPAHPVELKAFYVDRTEVTNADYKKFVDATGRAAPEGWTNGAPPAGSEALPVVNVTNADAAAYAAWAQKRLPTEEEWEAAARGKDARLYPWGPQWNPAAGNIGKAEADGRLEPVGSYPAGASPCGALDMIGNVWEWTASKASVYPGGSAKLGEYQGRMVMRGSTFTAVEKHDATWRGFYDGGKSGNKLGFRCVKDAQ